MVDSKRVWLKTTLLMVMLLPLLAQAQNAAQSAAAGGAGPEARLNPISFSQLPGWEEDDLQEIWPGFLANCELMRQRQRQWISICEEARGLAATDSAGLRRFFEARFAPHELTDGKNSQSGMLTGYYEPLLRGSRVRQGPYQFPLYRTPPDLIHVDLAAVHTELRPLRLRGRLEGGRVVPYPTRAEIESRQLLAGQEIVWVDDPIEAFFLQVQGSGRVQLPSGEFIRLGYAEQNGYPYRSIGRWLVEQKELKANEASMQGIKAWVAANPHRRDELLHQNPSIVFFKEITHLEPGAGPLGSMGLPLTAGRSLAVDPRFITMGTPVFLRTQIPPPGVRARDSSTPFNRLMLAQDTGSAILGAHRGDIFFGTGAEAGDVAGRMRAQGTMVVLLPKAQ